MTTAESTFADKSQEIIAEIFASKKEADEQLNNINMAFKGISDNLLSDTDGILSK